MKKKFSFLFFCALFIVNMLATAQTINKVEYFIDNDPGLGNGTNVSVTAAANIQNLLIPVDITALPKGFHNIYLRAKNDGGNWSLTNRWLFIKDNLAANLNKLEYFIDTDPGFGNATDVTITAGSNVANVAIPVDVSSLPAGFHNIYFRSKDDTGNWSLTNRWMFIKDNLAVDVNKFEYFIDADPGFGNATDVTIASGSDVGNVSIPIDISSLSTGLHNIYLRSKVDAGSWSLTNRWMFFKDKAQDNFQGGEYFFDIDPGFGNGTTIPFGGGLGTDISDFSFGASLNSVPNGLHYLFIRTKEQNGKWSLTNVIQFDKQVPLPITLLYFTARAKGKRSFLNWETATEINNNRFEIERSPDGIAFSKIGQLPGAGNSNTHINYQWYDNFPLKGNNYYRLKQVDIDSKFSYSPTRQVNFNKDSYFTISNNSTNGSDLKVTVNIFPSALSIFDITGRKLKEVNLTGSYNSLPVNDLIAGTYLAVLHKDGKLIAVEKFVVNK